MRFLVLLAMAAVGCGGGADPCDGIQSCISIRVEGNVSGLDQLRVKLAGHGDLLSPTPPAAFSLPVRLAVVVPGGTSQAMVGIDGLSGGQTIAASDTHTINLGAGVPAARETFTLMPATGDGSVLTDGSADGPPPGVVSFFPSMVDYGTVARGALGPTKPVSIVNNTNHAVTLVGDPMPTGDSNVFNLTTATTCFALDAGMTPAITVAANSSCDLSFQFAPTRSGNLKMDLTAMFDDGESSSFSLTGVATPVWVAENIAGGGGMMPPDLRAVWATGVQPNEAITVVGHDPSGQTPVFQSTGQANWFRVNGTPNGTGDLLTVFGLDMTQQTWVGGNFGLIWHDNGGMWTQQTSSDLGFPGNVTGIWVRDANTAFAVTDAGQNLRYNGATSSWSLSVSPVANQQFYAVCGHNQRTVAVGSQINGGASTGLMWLTDAQGGSWSQSADATLGNTTSIHSCWMSDDQNVWLVGAPGAGNNKPFIVHCSGATLTCGALESAGGAMGPLQGVSGRVDPATMKPDIWAVGSLGNQVLHSDGSGGTWAQVQTPNNQAMSGVFVTPTGEVIAVGFGGQINHLY